LHLGDSRFREKQFLLSCERGDIGSVKKLLAIKDCLNINCVDPLGRNALLIAIENENIEMIELLLDNNIETVDAILYAIGEENVEAVEIIVEHLEKIDKFNPENQGVEINEHSAFTPDMTPIILAAHKDNYECIKLFLDKKSTVPHPHDIHCSCHDCVTAREEDSLRLSRSRINAYRALTSPSLICLSAKDPILYAFELSWELRRLSYIENEFRSEYQELSQKCQKFSVNMLDQIRGSKELEIVLNHTTNACVHRRENFSSFAIQILDNTIQFVAHPNCQQLLAGIWYEGLGPGFRNRNIIYKCLLIAAVGLSFPILSISYLIAPKSAVARFTRRPFVKFLSHSASYMVFLVLLLMASQRNDKIDNMFREENAPDRKEGRGPPPTPVEVAIIIWVLGLIWVEIKQLWNSGLYDYCNNLWNILDFITNSLYLSTVALRAVAYYQVRVPYAHIRIVELLSYASL
uniref:ANK_REP_REGION domain-containing protein n=1 Tax=Angiostrongylus cantonensis TaxID=6313 RepID=A0A158P6X9_ANGCA